MEKLGLVPNGNNRVIIFVDHANIFKNLQKKDIRIDYEKLKEILTIDLYLVGAFVYLGIPDKPSEDHRKFLNYLTAVGYTLQTRPLKILSAGMTQQKGIDIFIYKDMVELVEEDAYGKAVLVSGDGDFVDAVKKLKELDKKIEIWSFKNSLSSKLKKEAGVKNVRYLDNILEQISL